MVILEQPIISSTLLDFLESEQVPVLANVCAMEFKDRNLNLLSENEFKRLYVEKSAGNLYTVSEYALDWVVNNLQDEDLNRQINVMKDKTLFRKVCSKVYPKFFFREVAYDDLFFVDASELPFPLVLKPSVGFLSAGVYTVENEGDWQNALADLKLSFQKMASLFPDSVVKDNHFILESYINGKEFAVDLYFNEDKPIIINIFEHPFLSDKDVKDRVYMTNKALFDKYLYLFSEKISELNKELKLKNIPVHVEVRVENGEVIPIEFNPLRFAGLCLNELHKNITGRHPLAYYFSKTEPDYEKMWRGKETETFSFAVFERQDKCLAKSLDVEKLKRIIPDILEIRENNNPKLPILAFVFSKTDNLKEIDDILKVEVDQLIK